jgi:hypothetical protein
MGLRADIFRDGYGHDYSNGGISSRCNAVTIVNVDGPFEVSDEFPAVRSTSRGGRPCLEPIDQPAGMLGPMFGGAYVVTSGREVLPLHDRYESPEEYARYSA